MYICICLCTYTSIHVSIYHISSRASTPQPSPQQKRMALISQKEEKKYFHRERRGKIQMFQASDFNLC